MRYEWGGYDLECEMCGETYHTKRYHSKTCSSKCRTAKARYDKKYEKTLTTIHEALDWLRSNRSPEGREKWERDLEGIARRASNITYR